MSTTNTALPYTQRVETIEHTAVAGQNGFFLPRGVYSRAANILAVKVNGTVLTGADYDPMARQARTWNNFPPPMGWRMPSTADVTQGVWLTASMTGGEVVAITFVTRDLLIAPPVPMAVYAPGGVFPAASTVSSYLVPHPAPTPHVYDVPRHAFVTTRAGLQIEFWHKTLRVGRIRTTPVPLMQLRAGLNWSPYWRSAVAAADGSLILDSNTFNPGGSGKRRWKLAYYDPASGARSALSVETLYTANVDDKIGMPNPPGPGSYAIYHPSSSIWVR